MRKNRGPFKNDAIEKVISRSKRHVFWLRLLTFRSGNCRRYLRGQKSAFGYHSIRTVTTFSCRQWDYSLGIVELETNFRKLKRLSEDWKKSERTLKLRSKLDIVTYTDIHTHTHGCATLNKREREREREGEKELYDFIINTFSLSLSLSFPLGLFIRDMHERGSFRSASL